MKRLHGIALGILLMTYVALDAYAGLVDYVQKPDDSYAVERVATQTVGATTMHVARLTSQTWHGIVWKHWLTVIVPTKIEHADTALLLITGGDNHDSGPDTDSDEARIMSQIASQTGSVVAVLEQVPNQPLFDGKVEDGIIAYTFEKYLDGDGDDWPLLFPMTKSAVRAMDAVQEIARDNHVDVKHFVVTGASKRGWTTWLTGAADSRVTGIAPMVIDTLNMEQQADHQLKVYGQFSDEVQDYTDRHIQERSKTPEGRRLQKEVDPFALRDKYTMPKLLLLGTNDPYWNVDSANLYFPELPGPKYLRYAANAGHGLDMSVVPAIIAFYESVLTGKALPAMTWTAKGNAGLSVAWEGTATKVVLWQATSPNRDFRDSTWTSTPLEGDGTVDVAFHAPPSGWAAYYVEVVFQNPGGMPYGLCTMMTVLPETYPLHTK